MGQAFLTGTINGLGRPDGIAGVAGFFGCFGFFASRLLRCLPWACGFSSKG